MVNYTLQYTRGNADNPTQTFDRAGNNMDPVNRFIPMSWDQRHTLNGTLMLLGAKYGGTVTVFIIRVHPTHFHLKARAFYQELIFIPIMIISLLLIR